jgi:hypothetical protein
LEKLPIIIIGSVVFFLALIAVVWRAMSLANASRPQGSSSNSGQINGGSVDTAGGFAGAYDTKYGFAWVDANDKSGKETIHVIVHSMDNAKDNPKALTFQYGKRYQFQAQAKLTDTATAKVLPYWGVSAILFDNHNNKIAEQSGNTDSTGFYNFTFAITPSEAGTFRIRVAAGDAADEEDINFFLPANTPVSALLPS